MKAPQLFALAIRLAGLFFVYGALAATPAHVFRFLQHLGGFKLWDAIQVAVHFAWPFAVAWWFLTGAPQLFKLVYPGENDGSNSTSPGSP